jgi:glutaredoxin
MHHAVRLYSLSTCSRCRETKKLLEKHRVDYQATDVDLLKFDALKATVKDISKFNPECSFPTAVIGKEVIVGYREKEILRALDSLESPIIRFIKQILQKLAPYR